MGRAELVLFHLLIGNSDAHGKNISFYVGRNGIDVAPAYDLVNVEIYGDEYDRDMAMAVGDCLHGLCVSLTKEVDSFDLSRHLVGEPAFGQGILDAIKVSISVQH